MKKVFGMIKENKGVILKRTLIMTGAMVGLALATRFLIVKGALAGSAADETEDEETESENSEEE